MKIRIAPEFLMDLRNALNQDFVQRVLDCVLDQKGQFLPERNDHRYTGLQDAWIRYASRGKTAYRVIFIRSKDTVTLYRAGVHSIEDEVTEPVFADGLPEVAAAEAAPEQPPHHFDFGILLSTFKPSLLRHAIAQMYHCGHKEIVLVSPYVSFTMLSRNHHFGRFLDKAIEEDTVTSLITRPPTNGEIRHFQELEERGLMVYFHKTIHAKLYLFDVDPVAQGGRTVPCRELHSSALLI